MKTLKYTLLALGFTIFGTIDRYFVKQEHHHLVHPVVLVFHYHLLFRLRQVQQDFRQRGILGTVSSLYFHVNNGHDILFCLKSKTKKKGQTETLDVGSVIV